MRKLVVSTEKIECPVCGQYSDIHDLGRAGIIPEELMVIRQYVKEGILSKILKIAEIVYQRMDPASTSMELSFSKSIEELTRTMSEKMEYSTRILTGISEKIAGPAIGDVSEQIIAEEFKQAFPKDDFDTSQAEKHGTDIVAIVIDRKEEVGRVSVSIKDTGSWSSSYITQLEKNMKHDGTKVGILVSKKLPKNTNATGEVISSGDIIQVVVHPKYALACYSGLRQIVVHMHKTRKILDSKEKEIMHMGKMSKILTRWISGKEYGELIHMLEEISSTSDDTREIMIQLQEHFTRKVSSACENQLKIRQQVLDAQAMLSELKQMLQGEEE